MTRTHEIKLDGYGAHTTLAEDRPIMLLGTAESYGIEMLHVVPGKDWAELTITATFNAPDGTSTDMLMSADGSITVPSEATAKSGSGKIVFTGVSNGIQRISCDLDYFFVAHSAINGVQSGGTAPSWFEQAVTRFMPAGGTAGQVLTKVTDTDFEAEWQDSQGGADGITPTIGENGNWFLGDVDTNKPSRGANGKSAYSYAQDGGYTGTEAEFAAKLAEEGLDKALYVVNITQNSDGTLSANKTYDEIVQAYNEGKYNIVAVYDSLIFPLARCSVELRSAVFSMIWDGIYTGFSIKPNNKVSYVELPLATTYDKLPNPYPLTFTGAVSATYDGSSAKTIEIPSGGGAGLGDFELIGTVDFSQEGMAAANARVDFKVTDVSEIVLVYNDLVNSTSSNSSVWVYLNKSSEYIESGLHPDSGKSGAPLNGWVFIKLLPGVGLTGIQSSSAVSATNYAVSPAKTPYNIIPLASDFRIAEISIANPPTQYYAVGGIVKVYVR